MTTNRRHKNIINPYASQPDYSYSSARNKLVIAGIHNCFINYGFFPSEGLLLNRANLEIFSNTDATLSEEDLRAYLTIYPQNGTYNTETGTIDVKSIAEGNNDLENIVRGLQENEVLDKYLSPTTPESRHPNNQSNAAIQGNEEDSPELIMRQNVSRLISIPYGWSQKDLSLLAQIFSLSANPLLSNYSPEMDSESPYYVPESLQRGDVDLEVWTNNIPPGIFTPKMYYNLEDDFYYYVRRTLNQESYFYDTGNLDMSRNNVSQAIRTGCKALLQANRKYDENNLSTLIDNSDVIFESYLDGRPNSRWSYVIKIAKPVLDELSPDEDLNVQLDSYKSPLEISQQIVNKEANITNKNSVYTVEYLSDGCEQITDVVKTYYLQTTALGISDGKLDGLNLKREYIRVENFPSQLSEFFDLNYIQPQNPSEDSVHLYFGPTMKIPYIVYNGDLYYKFLGETLFTEPSSNEEEDSSLLTVSTISVFNTQSSASLGYIFYLRDILSKTQGVLITQWPSWMEFITQYTIPSPRIDPQLEQRKLALDPSSDIRGPKLFETLTEIANKGNQNLLSSDPRAWNERNYFNDVNSALGNCDTGMVNRLKDLATILSVVNGSMNYSVLINRAVSHLKDELIRRNFELLPDAEWREELGLEGDADSLEAYIRNPSIVLRAIEERINQEINCLLRLDALGDELALQLQPYSLPPDVRSLVRTAASPPVGVEFSKTPLRGDKWNSWLKSMGKLMERLLISLLTGLVRELLESALGCNSDEGAEGDDSVRNSLKSKINLYGFVDLNDFIAGVDVIEVASELGLSNKKITFNYSEEEGRWKASIARTPPELIQIRQFHQDVSRITTPEEIKKLLTGTASTRLLDLIYEMVNFGDVDTDQMREDYPEILEEAGIQALQQNELVQSLYQESLMAGDTRYAILGLDTSQIIRDYYKALGDKLSEAQKQAVLLEKDSPEEAYCPPAELSNPFEGISDVQIRSQIRQRITETENRLDKLCQANNNWDLDKIKKLLESWSNIGLPPIVIQILEKLRAISAEINQSMSDLMSSSDMTYTPAPPRDQCANFIGTRFWSDVSFGEPNAVFPTVPREFPEISLVAPVTMEIDWRGIGLALEQDEQTARIVVSRIGNQLVPPNNEEILNAFEIISQLLASVTPQGDNRLYGPNYRFYTAFRNVVRPFTNPTWDQSIDAPTYLDNLYTFIYTAAPYSGEALATPGGVIPPPDGFRVFEASRNDNPSLVGSADDGIARTSGSRLDPSTALQWLTTRAEDFQPGVLGILPAARRISGTQSVESILRRLAAGASVNPNRDVEQELLNSRPVRDLFVNKVIASVALPPNEAVQERPAPQYMRTLVNNISQQGVRLPNGNPSPFILQRVNDAQIQTNEYWRSRFGNPGLIEGYDNVTPEGALNLIPSLREEWVKDVLDDLLTDYTYPSRSLSLWRNASETSYEQMCSIWYLSERQPELKESMNIITAMPFEEVGKCADESLVRAMMISLQSRIIPFAINTLQFQRIYLGWNTTSTMELITDYIYRTIRQDFQEKGLAKIFTDNLFQVYELYGEFLGTDQETPFDVENTSFEEQMKNIIIRWLATIWTRMANETRYWAGGTNLFQSSVQGAPEINPPTNRNTPFDSVLGTMVTIFEELRKNDNSTEEQKQFLIRMRDTLQYDDNYAPTSDFIFGALAVGFYYLPLPLINALYLIGIHTTMNPSGTFTIYDQTISSLRNQADERLYKIINPNYISLTPTRIDI
jgi:hypothetical protein